MGNRRTSVTTTFVLTPSGSCQRTAAHPSANLPSVYSVTGAVSHHRPLRLKLRSSLYDIAYMVYGICMNVYIQVRYPIYLRMHMTS